MSIEPLPSRAPTVRRSLSGATMGTRYAAVFVAPPEMPTAPIAASLRDAVERVDRQMSTWKPESDLCRVNRAPAGSWIPLPRELLRVLAAALDVERQSRGAFDIGVGDCVDAWGFGPSGGQPDVARAAQLCQTPRAMTAETLELDLANGRARKHAALSLDLCGIAKGFAVDEMARALQRHGLRDWLVGIDGELRAQGRKDTGEPWSIAVERPTRGLRELLGVVELADRAIATSGDYRRWMPHDGGIISHTIDPRAKAPLREGVAAVSVACASCMRADAWATALLVLGAEQGPRMAATLGLDALFLLREGGSLREIGVGPLWA